MLVSYLQLTGSSMPRCHRFCVMRNDLPPFCWSFRRYTIIYILHYPPFTRKEHYPSYINMSNRRYRSDRSKRLFKLIGKNFRTLRGYRQLTIERVAQDTYIPLELLYNLEAGAQEISPSLLVVICDYFHVLIDCVVYQDLSLEQ